VEPRADEGTHMKLSHIGVAVRDVHRAVQFFREKFGLETTDQGTGRGFHVAFLATGGTPVELIQDVTPGGIITKFIEKRGEGVHHISFEVNDIRAVLGAMQAQGVTCLDKEPRGGAHNSLVAFLHPKDTFGVLIELVEFPEKHSQTER
jgi:methylmalonyl-CoA/ethylmalonyl-CoA epimerase